MHTLPPMPLRTVLYHIFFLEFLHSTFNSFPLGSPAHFSLLPLFYCPYLPSFQLPPSQHGNTTFIQKSQKKTYFWSNRIQIENTSLNKYLFMYQSKPDKVLPTTGTAQSNTGIKGNGATSAQNSALASFNYWLCFSFFFSQQFCLLHHSLSHLSVLQPQELQDFFSFYWLPKIPENGLPIPWASFSSSFALLELFSHTFFVLVLKKVLPIFPSPKSLLK